MERAVRKTATVDACIEMQRKQMMVTATQQSASFVGADGGVYGDSDWSLPSVEESNKEFELIDPGMYVLELTEWERPTPVAKEFDPTGTKMRSKFTFTVREDEYWEGTTINAWMNISMNERSALYPFVKALLGGTVDPSLNVTPKLIVGKKIKAMVVHGDPDNQGRVWPKITSPIPYTTSRRTKATDPVVDAVAEVFDAAPDTDVPF